MMMQRYTKVSLNVNMYKNCFYSIAPNVSWSINLTKFGLLSDYLLKIKEIGNKKDKTFEKSNQAVYEGKGSPTL